MRDNTAVELSAETPNEVFLIVIRNPSQRYLKFGGALIGPRLGLCPRTDFEMEPPNVAVKATGSPHGNGRAHGTTAVQQGPNFAWMLSFNRFAAA